ncbi:MAG: GNAT family N-acetyltransferase [Armatimonadota bacterium]|nr:GNAT family N-acetyltransferase [Armatimonadota bacterium]
MKSRTAILNGDVYVFVFAPPQILQLRGFMSVVALHKAFVRTKYLEGKPERYVEMRKRETVFTAVQEMVEYVYLTDSNLSQGLEILNRNLVYDQTTIDQFRHNTIGDPDYDPSLALMAVENGKPCGLIVAVSRQGDDGPTGGIKFIAVDREFRNRGIGSELLARVERRLAELGVRSVNVGFTRPNYLMPGVDPRYTVACAFLLRRGYIRRGEAFNMDVDLAASDWSTRELEAKLAEQGIAVERLRRDEIERFRRWMTEDGWSAGWQYQVMRAATMEPIAVFVGKRVEDNSFVAFACYDGVRPGWFGPMGTTQSMRGTGIGSVTFLKCLQDMKAKGYRVCEINSVGPLYFYSKVANAVVSRIFWQFEKELASVSSDQSN